ncbi:MAG: glycosyltransferase [Abitibacteriaceae bacterium]|nr:glycosyltransferase [Abditibacteriaceae bacterium]
MLSVARKERPDLIFILNGDLLMPSTLNSMRAQDTRIFIFHADNPFPPNYANRPETLPNALASDCFFIWSRHLVEQLQQLGVRRAEYLPFGWDSEIFPYFGLVAEPKYDVVFVGGWDKEREEFLTPLAEEFKLRIWGPSYWGNRTRLNSPLRKCWQGDAALGPEAAKILVNSKIVLNVVRQQNLPDGVIMRTFEVPGCGGFMLSTRTQGAVDLFPEDRAGAYFSDGEECVRQIKRFLVADQERQRMAANAHVLVQQQHRYVDRAQRILNVWDEL